MWWEDGMAGTLLPLIIIGFDVFSPYKIERQFLSTDYIAKYPNHRIHCDTTNNDT